jgi:hypothetical protein
MGGPAKYRLEVFPLRTLVAGDGVKGPVEYFSQGWLRHVSSVKADGVSRAKASY